MRAIRILLLLIGICLSAVASASGLSVKDSVLVIGSDVKEIPAYKYADRSDIKMVDASKAVQLKEIGEYAFVGCSNLESILLPNGVYMIGEGAFRDCGLTKIVLPESLKAVPRYAFRGCEKLANVKFPANLEDIGSHSFVYCKSLKDLKIPESVAHIGSNVFSMCSSIEEVELPRNLKELESYAFSDCASLKCVRMPENKNMLGELIFSGCTSLETIVEYSPVPPTFDCDSFLFDPDDTEAYQRCKLVVRKGSAEAYSKAHGWSLFFFF